MSINAQEIVKETFETKLVPYLEKKEPEIKAIIAAKAGSAVKSLVSNQVLFSEVFDKIHDLLPAPLKMIVGKDIFVKYCYDNRETVLKMLKIQ